MHDAGLHTHTKLHEHDTETSPGTSERQESDQTVSQDLALSLAKLNCAGLLTRHPFRPRGVVQDLLVARQ